MNGNGGMAGGFEDEPVVRVATGLPRVVSSPMAFSISSDAPKIRDHKGRSVSHTTLSTLIKERSPEDLAENGSSFGEAADVHLGKRGSSVDKTNPFIGYFQTGQEEMHGAAMSGTMQQGRMSGSTGTGVGQPSYYPSVFLAPQKRFAEWIGSKSPRFPSFFKQEPADKSSTKDKMPVQNAGLFPSLRLSPLSMHMQQEENEKQQKRQTRENMLGRVQSLPTVMEVVSEPRSAKSSSASSTSRFEQDFEVLGSLGEGGQGAVYKVRSKVDGCLYAVKKVELPGSVQRDSPELEQALREVRSMATMPPHANVVRYHTSWIEESSGDEDSASTESVRGSEAGSLNDSSAKGVPVDTVAQEETSVLNETEPSFSLDFSSGSISFDQYSTPGFSFAESSESGEDVDAEVSFGEPASLGKVVRQARRETKTKKPSLVVYIQMELCGSPSGPQSVEPSSFNRLLDRLTFKSHSKTPKVDETQPTSETLSTLAAWLRSSLDERSNWSSQSATHLEGLKLFLGLAQGVAHMHSCGVIHRDLKPDNVFLNGNIAKIGDFGLSKSIFSDGSRFNNDSGSRERPVDVARIGEEYGDHTTALGTFTYASPEQLGYRFSEPAVKLSAASRLKSAKYSIKSDIFALGVILLEMCCPFSTMMERSQVLTGVRHGVVPQRALQHFPAEMTLVLRMTAIDPADR